MRISDWSSDVCSSDLSGMKVLLWLILIGLGIWVLRSKLRAAQSRANAEMPRPQIKGGEPMLCCAQCGVYFPASEAIHDGDTTVYCRSEERRVGKECVSTC